jgi:hypothetical protein
MRIKYALLCPWIYRIYTSTYAVHAFALEVNTIKDLSSLLKFWEGGRTEARLIGEYFSVLWLVLF